MAAVTAGHPTKPQALGRDVGPSVNGDALPSFTCMEDKGAEPGHPRRRGDPALRLLLTLQSKQHAHPAEPAA